MGELREKMRPRAEVSESIDAVIAKLKEAGTWMTASSPKIMRRAFGERRLRQDARVARPSAAPRGSEAGGAGNGADVQIHG